MIISSRFPEMSEPDPAPLELTYPLRTAARLTGLSPAVLRAWERRYGVVVPARTAGGTRRYSAADLERLRLVKAAVDAGHRIGVVAALEPDELRRRARVSDAPEEAGLSEVLSALGRLDAAAVQRRLSIQLSTLGAPRFAREIALPLVDEIGRRWSDGRLSIAAEHLATSILRSLLGAALQPTAASLAGPRIVFATPPGEPHELGLLIAALVALGAGAQPLYLGVDVPAEDLLAAARASGASAVALGVVTVSEEDAQATVTSLREGLPARVALWLGGAGAASLGARAGVEVVDSLDALERRVALMALEV